MKKELLEDLESLMSFVPDDACYERGYKDGWVKEANLMREAIDNGIEITEDWCLRDINVQLPKPDSDEPFYYAGCCFDGAYNFRAIAQNLVQIHSLENPSKEILQYRDNIFNNVLK